METYWHKHGKLMFHALIDIKIAPPCFFYIATYKLFDKFHVKSVSHKTRPFWICSCFRFDIVFHRKINHFNSRIIFETGLWVSACNSFKKYSFKIVDFRDKCSIWRNCIKTFGKQKTHRNFFSRECLIKSFLKNNFWSFFKIN